MSYRQVMLSDQARLFNALHEWKNAGGQLEEVTDAISELIEQRIERAMQALQPPSGGGK